MSESRRERKKRRTRELLIETALRLFDEQGYEQTTVAQIADAADVATRTFFNYFPSKEDVLFADDARASAIPLEVIASRRPGESIASLLTRMYEAMLADYRTHGVGHDPSLMAIHTKLIMSVPALLARSLRLDRDLRKRMALALVEVYPDQLDPISAAAVIGSLGGATEGAALMSIELDQPEERFWQAMRRAVDIALHGPPPTR